MKLYTVCIASLLALGSASAGAVDLSEEQGALLRERAQVLKAQRERDPSWDGGTRYSNAPQPEQQAARDRQATQKTAKTQRKRVPIRTKVKRAVKKLPGALVRGR
jgi:hypothetical protein